MGDKGKINIFSMYAIY